MKVGALALKKEHITFKLEETLSGCNLSINKFEDIHTHDPSTWLAKLKDIFITCETTEDKRGNLQVFIKK